MLTRWLTFTALLAGSANPGRGAVTVAPTCRVKGHREAELTLNCGDGKNAGVVQYWHTPFGQLKTPGFSGKLDPVFMHHDGSLVVPNASILHSGLYYCLLKHAEGTTLWPYELHVSQQQKHSKYKRGGASDAFRVKRDAGSEAERQADVSDGQFAGAVAASVVLTFVLGFSAGALARSHILRCLRAVTSRLRSQRKQRCQTDTPRSEATVTTLPPMYDNQAFEMERVLDDTSANCESMDTTISSTTSSPPAKPKRSFRTKREDEVETTAYLEGCDYMRVEERGMEEEAGRSVEERGEECDGETEDGKRGFYLLGEDGGSQIETEEDECSEERDEKDGGDEGKGAEEASEQENRSKEEGEEEAGVSQERGKDEEGEKEGRDGEKKEREEDVETEDSSEKGEGSGKTEDTMKDDIIGGGGGGGGVGGEDASSRPCRGRRSRVIRLYQYDDDGQRYSHLPDPAPDEPAPAPRLKQRSASLTRLSAIMAAASAGPLDRKETGKEEREQRPHFHMEI